MSKIGRPTKYKKEFCVQAEKLCKKGFTDKDLAEFFEVQEQTINNWKEAHPEFLESLKSAKEQHDVAVVEKTLLQRALGYEISEVKVEEQEGSPSKTTTTNKHVAPSDTALIFFLKNRNPERWRDKTETKVTLSDDFDSLMGDAVDSE